MVCGPLRCALLRGPARPVHEGVGVVADSDPAGELARRRSSSRRCCRDCRVIPSRQAPGSGGGIEAPARRGVCPVSDGLLSTHSGR